MTDATVTSAFYLALIAVFILGVVVGRLTAGGRRRPQQGGYQPRRATAPAPSDLSIEENVARLTATDRARIERLLSDNQLIEAIKEIRIALGTGLKESKDMAEHMRDALRRGARQ